MTLNPNSQTCSVHDATLSTNATVLISSNARDSIAQHVVMGCDDGTIFVFRTDPSRNTFIVSPPSHKGNSPTGIRHVSPSPSTSSRRSGQSSMPPTALALSSRLRAVSDLTKEMVEAPKNFVDYDDEEGKLRALLNHDALVRDRVTSGSGGFVRSRKPPSSISTPIRHVEPAPLMSTTSISGASHHRGDDACPLGLDSNSSLLLAFHIIPSHNGHEHSISALKIFGEDHFISLHRSGQACII